MKDDKYIKEIEDDVENIVLKLATFKKSLKNGDKTSRYGKEYDERRDYYSFENNNNIKKVVSDIVIYLHSKLDFTEKKHDDFYFDIKTSKVGKRERQITFIREHIISRYKIEPKRKFEWDLVYKFVTKIVEYSNDLSYTTLEFKDSGGHKTASYYESNLEQDLREQIKIEALKLYPLPTNYKPIDWEYHNRNFKGGYKDYQLDFIAHKPKKLVYNDFSKNIVDSINYIQSIEWIINNDSVERVRTNNTEPEKNNSVIIEELEQSEFIDGGSGKPKADFVYCKKAGKLITDRNKPIHYKTNDGFYTITGKYETDKKTIERNPKITYWIVTNNIKKEKTVSALTPNIIHALDSMFLRMVVLKLKEKNIDVTVIHDSFGVHPNNYSMMIKIAKDVFKEIFNMNILTDIEEQFKQQLKPQDRDKLKSSGINDINNIDSIKDSDWFIS